MKTVLGIDLGGTKVLIGELSLSGEVLHSIRYPSNVTSQRIAVDEMKKSLKDYLNTHSSIGEIQAIGIGLVGRIDRENGKWIEIHPELSKEIEVAREIEEEFHLPCFLGNDVYCATLAEKTYGMGVRTSNFIYMNVGTGIAAGCVVNGKILEGSHFDAGEIGHMVVDMHSDIECPCGRKGCVEVLASGLGMHNRAISLLEDYPQSIIKKPESGRIHAQQIFDGYDKKDKLCQIIIDDALNGVATTIMNLIRVTDPDAIVMGGGVASSQWFIDLLKTRMNPKTIRFIDKGIAQTQLDIQTIGLRGAGVLAINGINK